MASATPLPSAHETCCAACEASDALLRFAISTGGIGADDNWTLTIIRTERGEEWMKGVIDAGLIEARPGESDPVAMNLLTKLSTVSRKRWPGNSLPEDARAPGMLPIVT